MVSEQHTPGPWFVSYANMQTICVKAEHGQRYSGVVARMAITRMSSHAAIGEANARLISAAPDLLEAVTVARAILNEYYSDGGKNEEQRAILLRLYDTAIAKSTGAA